MFSTQGMLRTTFLSMIGSAIFVAAAPPSAIGAVDRIKTNANTIFANAGGTSKGWLSQKQFQAAEKKIDDAMNRLVRDGTIGSDPAPEIVVKPDLSKKERISWDDFLQYFKGLATQRDLQIRRARVDQALAQQGTAEAAAKEAWANEQQAEAEREAAQQQAQAAQDRNGGSDADALLRHRMPKLRR